MAPPSDRIQREWRFLQLTLFIVAWMFISPHVTGRWLILALLQLFMLNCVLVTLWANPEWRRLRGVTIGLWLVSLAGALSSALIESPESQRWIRVLENLAVAPLLGLVAAGSLRFVFRRGRRSIDEIFATVVAYLLVAVLFGQLYELVLELNPQSFNIAAVADRPPQLVQSDLLYFSFVTLATLGYGDVLPVDETARSLAVVEAVVGQFYVAVIVSVFIGMYTAARKD